VLADCLRQSFWCLGASPLEEIELVADSAPKLPLFIFHACLCVRNIEHLNIFSSPEVNSFDWKITFYNHLGHIIKMEVDRLGNKTCLPYS
jgi:hypothetical protein